MDSFMEMEFLSIKEENILGIGKMEKRMDLELMFIQMVINIKEGGIIANIRRMEHIFIITEIFISENGKKKNFINLIIMNVMVLELIFTLMVTNIKESGKRV